MGQLKISVVNIQSKNPFIISYKIGRSAYPLDSDYTQYNGIYSGGTTSVDIIGNFNFGEEYWIKISDTVYTDRYVIENIYLNDQIAYQTCLFPSPTLTPSSGAVSGFGLLYNWFAVNDVRGLAPSGWRIPTRTDTSALESFVGSGNGLKLKEINLYHWLTNNGTDNYGFKARGSGFRSATDGSYTALTTDWEIWNFGDRGFSSQYLWGINNGGSYYTNNVVDNNTGLSLNLIYSGSTGPATVTDYDGNVYNTVTIGSQLWMVGNLKVTHYNNGDAISLVTDNTAWIGLSSGGYCYYDNNIGYV